MIYICIYSARMSLVSGVKVRKRRMLPVCCEVIVVGMQICAVELYNIKQQGKSARLRHCAVIVDQLLLLLCIGMIQLGFHAGKQQGANGIGEMLVVVHEQAQTVRVNAQ